MKLSLGKAALLALSMMPVTVFASHWSYEGEGSPEHWGALNEENKIWPTAIWRPLRSKITALMLPVPASNANR